MEIVSLQPYFPHKCSVMDNEMNLVSCFFLWSKSSSKCTSFHLHSWPELALTDRSWNQHMTLTWLCYQSGRMYERIEGALGNWFFGRKPELNTRLQTLTNVPQPCPLIPGSFVKGNEWEQKLYFCGATQDLKKISKSNCIGSQGLGYSSQ